MAATRAVRFMHADDGAACRTGPPGFFRCEEPLRAVFLDSFQIRDNAEPVVGTVARVKTEQGGAGKRGAGKAKPMALFRQLPAVLDRAVEAGLRLVSVFPPATRTPVALSQVCAAQAAVQAARCDHCGFVKRCVHAQWLLSRGGPPTETLSISCDGSLPGLLHLAGIAKCVRPSVIVLFRIILCRTDCNPFQKTPVPRMW